MSVHNCDLCGREVGWPSSHRAACAAPVYCECPEPDFDAIGQCRRCWLADLRSPQLAVSAARLAATPAP